MKKKSVLKRLISVTTALVLTISTANILEVGVAYAGYTSIQYLSSNSAGTTLNSNVIYSITDNTSIYASTGGYGLNVNGNSVLHIPEGKTLTIYGGSGSGRVPGGAGINLISGNTLTITGGGKLNVYGGSSGSASSGYSGGYETGGSFGNYTGGKGGYGAGGAGAAIGGSGGYGGYGGDGGDWKDNRYYGSTGYSGSSGGSMGTLYVIGNTVVTASAGNRNTYSGSGGNYGGGDSRAGNGGGGGGGGYSGYPSTIGGGAGGGGGGGGGGSADGGTGGSGGGGGAGYGSGGIAASEHQRIFGKRADAYYGGAGGEKYASTNQAGGNGGNRGNDGGSGTVKLSKGASLTGYTASSTIDSPNSVKYSVNLDNGGGEGVTPNSTIYPLYGTRYVDKVTIPTKPGFTFDGYFSANSGGDKYFDDNGNATNNAVPWLKTNVSTLYAQWSAIEYSVILDTDGGQGGGTIKVQYNGSMPAIALPMKTGYVFDGYYSAQNGQGTKYYDNKGAGVQTYDQLNGITLYANWVPQIYDIKLYSQGSFVKELSNVKYGELILPSATDLKLERAHHNFIGWNLYDEQNWSMYTPNVKYKAGLTSIPNGEAIVYAAWQIVDNYTITYNANAGTAPPIMGNVYAGEDYVISNDIPTRTDYTFVGWSEDSSATLGGTSKIYNAGETIQKVTSSKTLYAVWKQNPWVSYNANGGSFTNYIDKAYYPEGNNVNVEFSKNPTRIGYDFAGWATLSTAVAPDYTNIGTNNFSMPSSNVTLYAVWNPSSLDIKYSIATTNEYSFDPMPIKIDYGKTYEFGVKIPSYINTDKLVVSLNGNTLSTPTYEIGADGSKLYKYKVISPTVEQNIEVSGYSAAIYGVSLNTNGGKLNTVVSSYMYGVGATLPADATKVGYNFGAWYDNESLTGVPVTQIGKADTGDKLFYASWLPKSYKVQFDNNGGSGNMSEQTITYDTSTLISTNTFTHPDYDFLGWSMNKDSVEPQYLDGESVMNLATGESGNESITLYAVWDVPSYKVIYDFNGGIGNIPTVSYKKGIDVDVDFNNVPTRSGYTFKGWAKTHDAISADFTELGTNKITNIDQDVVLYGIWEANDYTINFNSNNSLDIATTSQALTFDIPSELKQNAFTPPNGKEFAGWHTIDSATKPLFLDGQKVLNLITGDVGYESIDLYAIWSDVGAVFVSFDANGGTWEGSAPESEIVSAGSANITTSIPKKDGYTLKGWTDGITEYSLNDATISGVNTSKILYAVWEAEKYNVIFDTQGGDVLTTQMMEYNKSETLTSYSGSKPNCIFTGWSTSANGEVAYKNGQTVKNLPTNNNEITLYAVWMPQTYYALSYNANGGTGGPGTSSYAQNSDVTLDFSNVPIKQGYDFKAWNTKPDGLGDNYETGILTINANTTLYAIWEKKIPHRVIYDAAGTIGSTPNDINIYYKDSVAQIMFNPYPSKQGYTFGGWTDGTTKYTETGTDKVTFGDSDVKLTPDWNANKYKIIFNNNLDKKEQEMTYDKRVNLQANTFVALDGYQLMGWAITPNGGALYQDKAEVMNLTTVKDGVVNLYASWGPIQSTITLDKNGGKDGTDQVIGTYGAPLPSINLSIPTREGYIFDGYNTNKAGTGEQYYNSSMDSIKPWDIKVDSTLYAKWLPIEYTLTYMQEDKYLDDQNLKYDQTNVTIPSDDYFKNKGLILAQDYKLMGWTTKRGSLTPEYSTGEIIPQNALWQNGGNVKLYAVINKDEKYTIAYDGNGGKNPPIDQTQYNSGSDVDVKVSESPNMTGFTFLGWAKEENPQAVAFSENGATKFKILKDTKLVAVWDSNTCNVVYDANGGLGNIADVAIRFGDETNYKLSEGKEFNREGYTLQGWSTAKNGAAVYDLGYKLVAPLSNHNEKITLYAVWKAEPIMIEFDPLGGEVDTDFLEINFGEKYGRLPVPTLTGSKFLGWYTNLNDESAKVTSISTVSIPRDHKLYAKWEDKEYSLKVTESPLGTITVSPGPSINGNYKANTVLNLNLALSDKNTKIENVSVKANGIELSEPIESNGTYNYQYTITGDTTITIKSTGGENTGGIGGGGGGGGAVASETKSKVIVTVDGKNYEIGSTITEGKETIVKIDDEKLKEKISKATVGSTVSVTIQGDSAISSTSMSLDNVSKMKDKNMTISISNGKGAFSIPAKAINPDDLKTKLQENNLNNILIKISTSYLSGTEKSKVKSVVESKGASMIGEPMEGYIIANTGDKKVEVEPFGNYATKTFELPTGVDLSSISAVSIKDGKISHAPTNIYFVGGQSYAQVSVMDNSNCALISNNKVYLDSQGKWYETYAKEISSRMIESGVNANNYEGERAINRGEFATILVSALGLPTVEGNVFKDISSDNPYSLGINTAYAYKIVGGKDNGVFDSEANITRQEAMVMLEKAAQIAGIAKVQGSLIGFSDEHEVDQWAKEAAMFSVGSGLMGGSEGKLNPKDDILRSETAVIVVQLLKKSNLIN